MSLGRDPNLFQHSIEPAFKRFFLWCKIECRILARTADISVTLPIEQGGLPIVSLQIIRTSESKIACH
ncbi:hypothetical protein KM043_000894 [Ampulex compressa]|nr:hypothetical protein KM043_000894 [Ampulex compressa]